MNIHEALEIYNTFGFSMIPITRPVGGWEDGKRPAINEWMTYINRKPTVYEQQSWWHNDKKLNIAVLTGSISKLAVIDLDNEESYRALTGVYPAIEDTLVVKTGKGYHIYFRLEENRRTITFNLLGKLHHIKMEASYVVAPPSKHISGRTYEFHNLREPNTFDVDNLIELIQGIGGSFPSTNSGTDRPITWASELCTTIPSGGRNTVAAQLCGLLIRRFSYDPGLVLGLMIAWNKTYCDPPLDSRELEQLVDGEYRRYGPRT